MMRSLFAPLALAVAVLVIAVPATADVAALRLPLPPPGMDYIDIDCPFGLTRVQADGKVIRMGYAIGVRAGSATPGEVRHVMRAPIHDSILPRVGASDRFCRIERRTGGVVARARVQVVQDWRTRPGGMYALLARVDAISARASQQITLPPRVMRR